jgi:hypothetical protein
MVYTMRRPIERVFTNLGGDKRQTCESASSWQANLD